MGAQYADWTKQWHELKVRISGTKVKGYLDGKLYLEDTLAQPVSGRIGLWSKADSHMYFADTPSRHPIDRTPEGETSAVVDWTGS